MASDLAALRPIVKTRIDALALGVPVSYQGTAFVVPSGAWVRVTVRWGDGRKVTGGTGVTGQHVRGVLFLDVFGTPTEAGLAAAEDMADTLRDSFACVKVGATNFREPSGPEVLDDVATNRAAKWNRVQVKVPFVTEEA